MNFEFQHITYAGWGLLGLVFWIIGYFYFLKNLNCLFLKNIKNRDYLFRSLVFLAGVTGWLYISFALAGPRKPLGMDKKYN